MTDTYAQRSTQSFIGHRPLATALLAAFVLATLASAVGCVFASSATYAVTGFAACAVVTVPMLQPAFQLLSPWTLMAVIVYDACGLRGLAMALDLSGGGIESHEFFLLGHSPSYFWWPSVMYVVALALVAAGYMIAVSRREPDKKSQREVVSADLHRFHSHVTLVVGVLGAIGFLAFAWYVHASGGLATLSSCSAQRGADGVVRVGGWGVRLSAGYSSNGVPRALNVFSTVAFWIYLVHILGGSSIRLFSLRTLAAVVLLANALLLPIYSSSRSDVGFMALVSVAIFLAMRPTSRERWRVIRNVGLFALVLLAAMTFIRAYGCNTGTAQPSDQSDATSPSVTPGHRATPLIERISRPISRVLVYNRNHGDMYTASLIVRAVPDQLPYAHGRTIGTWFVTPIPRSLWPDRPRTNSGVEIGEVIYGNGRVSVPPGFVGELYWNFGIAGVLIGAVGLGSLMGGLHRRCRRFPQGDPLGTLAIAAVSFPLGAYVMEQGVGGGLFRWLLRAVALAVGYLLCTAWFARRLRLSSGDMLAGDERATDREHPPGGRG